ncbi:MAG TPA: hypothetical protein VGA13_10405 [Acidimicrobiales bacterium]
MTVTITPRFRGPDSSANGGVTCGLLAAHVDRTPGDNGIEVTLRRPPPLGAALSITVVDDGAGATMRDGNGELVAEAKRVPFDMTVLPPPALDQIDAASVLDGYALTHPFPGCFVCGPDRARDDGLRLFPRFIDEGLSPRVASRWNPPPDMVDDAGHVVAEVVWGALDCPSVFAYLNGDEHAPYVLGRITAELVAPCPSSADDEPLVVTGWQAGPRQGRKLFGGSAVFAGRRLIARARATWIELGS